MVVNDHFIMESHTTFNCMKNDIQTQLNKNISLLYCASKKVQSSTEKFHWSKKLRKTENFSVNLKIRVPLASVNLHGENSQDIKSRNIMVILYRGDP